MAAAPRSVALMLDRTPWKEPRGVRAAETMHTSARWGGGAAGSTMMHTAGKGEGCVLMHTCARGGG